MTDPTDTVFCRYEGESFPSADFERDQDWGLVHKHVEPRHSALGDLVDDTGELEQTGGA